MALTAASALTEVLQAALQSKVLEPLRAALIYANRSWAEMGRFAPGGDVIKFGAIPDLSVATTPLTEGTPPTAVALSVTAVSVAALEYGNLIDITNVAKVKSPFDLAMFASERLARNAAESIDQVVRDEVATSGTVFFSDPTAVVRSDLTIADTMTAAVLRRLSSKMFKSKVPVPADGYYRIIVSPDVYFDLRNETAAGSWQEILKYTENEPIMAGEIGRLEQFRVFRAVNAPTFASTTPVHASIAFGELPGWGWGDLETLRTYDVPPGGDHADPLGQIHKVGWRVQFGVASLDNGRFFRCESAATAL